MRASTVEVLVAVAPLFAASNACSDDLPDPAIVVAPRLAAIRADPPAARVGDDVIITPLVVRPQGADDTRLRSWACSLADGADPRSCVPPGSVSIAPIDGGMFVLRVESSVDTPEVVVYLALCASSEVELGTPLDAVRCAGGGRPSMAFKRVALRDEGMFIDPNPTSTPLVVSPMEGCSARCPHDLSIEVTVAGDETQVLTDFLATAGEIDPFRVEGLEPTARWHPPRDFSSRVELWAITRDGGGGVTWVNAVLEPR
ncbi:MAG: hypothetical protein IT379_18535 [Deltaproteobacteria bacterium]|nr:hypothetical protein [Deltaproteobacteria bacterium]